MTFSRSPCHLQIVARLENCLAADGLVGILAFVAFSTGLRAVAVYRITGKKVKQFPKVYRAD